MWTIDDLKKKQNEGQWTVENLNNYGKPKGMGDFKSLENKITPPIIEEATPKKSGFLNDVFGKDAYSEFKSTHQDTPNFLKPVGFALESVNRIPLTNRLLNQSADFLGVKRINGDGSELKTLSTGNKLADGITDVGANLIGSSLAGPGGGANLLNATDGIASLAGGKVAALTGKKILPSLARGSVDAAAGVGLEDFSKGNFKQIPQDVAINALGGGVLGGGGQLVGDVAKTVAPKIGKLLPDLTANLSNVKPKDLLSDLVTTNSKVTQIGKPLDEVLNPKKLFNKDPIKADLTPTLKTQNPLNFESNINTLPVQNNVLKAQEPTLNMEGKQRESKFKTNTMRNAEMLKGEEVQKTIDNIKAMYEVKPNEQSVARATEELKIDPQAVINRIKSSEALNSAEDATAAGLITNQLRQEADQTGDFTKLKDWLETVQPKVTNIAQGLQALSTWKKLDASGALVKFQQVVGQVNREGEKLYGKKFTPVEITTDEMKFINDTMKNVENMADGREKDLEFAKVKQLISEKVPSTVASKVAALQRISLLLNPKTQVRNILGNTILGGLENIKDIPGSLIDRAVSLKTGQRTTLAPSLEGLATQGKGLLKGAKETLQDARLGVSTNPSAGQFEIPQSPAFKINPNAKGLGKLKNIPGVLEKTTNTALEFGDRPFYSAAYDDALRTQMKINKVSEATDSMKEIAKQQAEDRTLQNVSKFVDGFKAIQKGLNYVGSGVGYGNKQFGLGNSVLPFVKTPANILDKITDYSPIGSIKGITQLISKEKFNQKQFVDRISRSITGSAAMYLGYELAKNGVIIGSLDKDKDVAALQRQTGKSAYSFKVGDTYRTFDWSAPASIALAVGADIYQNAKSSKDAKNVVFDAVKTGGQTLFDQSLLQGLQKLFGGTSGPVEGIVSTLANVPTQFVPTASNQMTQLLDPAQRDTYSETILGSVKNKIKSKIPGLAETLPQKVDTLGREVEQFQGKNNLFNVLLNPGYTTTEKATPGEKMVLDIYKDTGSKIQFPRVADKSITYKVDKNNSETIQLTPEEKVKFQKYIGEKTANEFDKLASYKTFQEKDAKEKAKLLQLLLTKIYNEGESNILNDRGVKEYR